MYAHFIEEALFMNKLKVIILICLAVLFLGMPVSAAPSDTTTATVTVAGGELNLEMPTASVDFGSITIDGEAQALENDLGPMVVSDFTGTGNGWGVTVGATQFKDTGTNTLPLNSLSLNGTLTITKVGTTSATPPTQEGTGPYTLDSGSVVKILNANGNEGVGKYEVAFITNALKLSVNTTNLKASNYTSTITYTITAGP